MFQRMQLVTVASLAKLLLNIPPPLSDAELPVNVQLITVALLLLLLNIPPPLRPAELPVNVQFVPVLFHYSINHRYAAILRRTT